MKSNSFDCHSRQGHMMRRPGCPYEILCRPYDSKAAGVVLNIVVTGILLVSLSVPSFAQQGLCLSLEDCRSMAGQNNRDIANAALDIRAAEAQKGEALAEYFPKVSINAFGYYAFDPLLEIGVKDILGNSDMANNITSWVNQNAPMYGINPYYSTLKRGYSATVSAIQPVYAGGRIVYGNRLAALGVEAARLQSDIQRRETQEDVEKSYWQVVSLEEKMKTVDEVQKMLDNLQKDLVSAIDAGIALESDMLQLKLKQNELASTRTRLRGSIRLAKMNLCNSIGLRYTPYSTINPDSLPHIDSIRLTDRLAVLDEPMAYWRDENEIVAGREETRLLDIAVDAKKMEKRMTVGEVLPQIGIGVSYGYGEIVGDPRPNGAVFATVKIPISDWGKYSRKIRRYDYYVQKARNDRDYMYEQLLLQVRQLWLDLTVSWEQMLLAEEDVAVSQSSVDQLTAHYRAGLVPLSELLEAQTGLRQSADASVDAQIACRTALQSYLNLFQE